jgi:hypothetical protein
MATIRLTIPPLFFDMIENELLLLPSDEAVSDNIREAFEEFVNRFTNECGIVIYGELRNIAETFFVGGYCAGHNYLFDTLKGQQDTVNLFNEITQKKQ